MPPVRSFAAFGLFIREQLLPADVRGRLAASMIQETGELAGIFGHADGVNPQERRAWEVEVPSALAAEVERRLAELQPALEQHFAVSLAPAETASYLRYPAGAFYRVHRDRPAVPDASNAHRRAVSIVLFVNDQDDEPGFAGGNLRFYGLLGEGPLAEIGLDAQPAAGTLIAFPSTLEHEVTTVDAGVRCTVVAWFNERS